MNGAKRLIVNADDLGRSPAVTRGALEAHRRGIVTSASLSVNLPAAAEVPALAEAVPGLGIGLHLTFTGGPPVLQPERLPTLADFQGRLPGTLESLDAARPEELMAEARAQLRRFRELMGRDPTHLDSRQHAHRRPAVLETLLTLAWETGLPVRNASRDVQERLRREGIPTTDQVTVEFHGDGATLEALVTLLGGVPPGTTELMCRPSLGDEQGAADGPAPIPRGGALDALTHREARQILQAAGVRLIHFGGL
ncbi:MAG TPA: ChbG/HpnK family deacetylase [Vicinamibacteria bacterium]|nr:ChbG/HpnK family deacetylase [Vicinamibacteria bacterium]